MGVAVFDYDGDGRPDIYFTNGALDPVAREERPGSGIGCITTKAT